MFEDEPEGASPLDPDEAAELIPSHLRSRADLNAWEQANILRATEWTLRARTPVFDEKTVRELHRRMFDETWQWAGKYRTSDKTIGVYWATVPEEVRKLVDDGKYWIEQETFGLQEAALRLHHRMVKIHPFANGNGRHARLWADLILRQHNRELFEWKAKELNQPGEARRVYIAALQSADAGDYEPLCGLLLGDQE